MRRPLLRLSFQTKIVGLVLLAVGLPALLLGVPLLRRSDSLRTDQVRETVGSEGARVARQLDEWMEERVREVTRWSASVALLEGVESLRGWGSDPVRARREVDSGLQTLLGGHPVYESLFIVDPRGAFLASTRPETWEDWGRRLIKQGGLRRGTVVSPLHRSEGLGRSTALVVHRLPSRDDETMAYFVARLDLAEVGRLLGSRGAIPEGAFWLLDEDGHVLVQEGRILPRRGDVVPDLPRSAGEGPASVAEGRLPGVGPSLFAVRRLRGPMPGFVVATVPVEAAYAHLRGERFRLLALGLVAFALLALTVALLARRVLRPIAQLSQAARRLSSGALEVSLPVQGHDEVSELTRAFNQMAGSLRDDRTSLDALSGTDRLTGLPNRRHFEESLDREIRRSEREGRALSLLLLDLDPFEVPGNGRGDGLVAAELRRVAVEVVQTVRSTDLAFRYSTDELSVLLHTCDKGQALQVAEKVRRAIAPALALPDAPPGTTVSIGVATFPDDGSVARALVDAALGALQLARSDGRNCVVAARGASAPTRHRTESLVHLRPGAVAAAVAPATPLPAPDTEAQVVASS